MTAHIPESCAVIDRAYKAKAETLSHTVHQIRYKHSMNVTYHGTPKSYWESLDPNEPYVPADYLKDGFIHTTDGPEAISMTLTRFYKSNPEPFVLLHIDKDCVTSPVRYDDPAEIFPHIYGPLNRDAILAIEEIRRSSDGTFCKPLLKW